MIYLSFNGCNFSTVKKKIGKTNGKTLQKLLTIEHFWLILCQCLKISQFGKIIAKNHSIKIAIAKKFLVFISLLWSFNCNNFIIKFPTKLRQDSRAKWLKCAWIFNWKFTLIANFNCYFIFTPRILFWAQRKNLKVVREQIPYQKCNGKL